jgi:hypothetical protein
MQTSVFLAKLIGRSLVLVAVALLMNSPRNTLGLFPSPLWGGVRGGGSHC